MLLFFYNTYLNNTPIILFTIVDADTFKIKKGYPKIINNKTFPGVPNKKHINSILYNGNNSIYIIYEDIYIKYNLLKNNKYEGYPKKIKNNFKYLHSKFYDNITNSIYINKNKALIFSNLKYIFYDINLIENNKNINPLYNNVIYNIKDQFNLKNNLNYDCIIYNYTDNIYLLIHDNYMYIKNNNNIVKFNLEKKFYNLWKLQ